MSSAPEGTCTVSQNVPSGLTVPMAWSNMCGNSSGLAVSIGVSIPPIIIASQPLCQLNTTCLLMPWLLVSPGHQQLLYWLHEMGMLLLSSEWILSKLPATFQCLQIEGLPHPLDKMTAILQTAYISNVFFEWKCFGLWFHWSLFLRFELTIFQNWFR